MKNVFIIVFLLFNLNLSAQSGDYVRKVETKKGEILEWTLSLHPDGTFLYNFYRNLGKPYPEENFYGKGTWKSNQSLVFFFTDKERDIDEQYELNLNNSKARIHGKSIRDKSNRVVKTSLRFYDSELSEIKGLELFKRED
ncbi:MAG TPA: hypothetical protein VJ945_02790 [Flavobacteriaceae bacterium]|nr:hypothetical protein [Flavobacteriaceae bacterium]